MSEFTSGVLFRHSDLPRMEGLLATTDVDGFLYGVNSEWHALFLADEWLQEAESLTLLLHLSREVPLLYLFNAEDHAWGYRIFTRGREVAMAVVPLDSTGVDGGLESMDNPLSQANPSEFRAFGVDDETIVKLAELVRSDSGPDREVRLGLFDEFKRLLGLEEFEWMSYSYLIDEVIDDL